MPDLCTIQYVANVSGNDTGKNAAIYQALVTAASAFFLTMTNRKAILATPFQETRDGDGSWSLIVRNTPILSVSSLTINGTPWSAYAGTGSGWAVSDNGFEVELFGGRFYFGRRNVSISYTAGWATVPAEIQQAVAELVLWKKAKMPRIDTVSHSLQPGETISYSMADVPTSVRTVMEQYKVLGGFR